jgi:hypothetical protein
MQTRYLRARRDEEEDARGERVEEDWITVKRTRARAS